jgi:hypothetical protein
MRRRRLLALLALVAALLAAGATAELDQVFARGAFAGSAADATNPLHARDELIAPTPPTHLAAVVLRGSGSSNRLARTGRTGRTGVAVLAAAALLAALASLRLGHPGRARHWRSSGTSSLGRGPPQLLAI